MTARRTGERLLKRMMARTLARTILAGAQCAVLGQTKVAGQFLLA
ncbi:MAG TPA: hypothetical protein PKE45_22820 [Caldilineaceae bacterium]|nr:hypothetical protein [Caldilineaceae bacterium]